MKVTEEMRQKLFMHGFKWLKDNSTDTVVAADIEQILPAANGLTVVYRQHCVIAMSTAVVNNIEFPLNLESTWICVEWESIEDERWKKGGEKE